MKKAIIKILSVLCIGLMVTGSASENICAVTYNNPKQQVSAQVKNNEKYTEQSQTLTKSQALTLVKKLEPEVDGFTYMGNETTYECIKENGIKGYVFLPNCDGDMAYLVDKQTSHIYYFHPSGYFELLQ